MRRLTRVFQVLVGALLCASGCWWVTPAAADVRLPKIFGDRMVFQQGQKANLWGWAEKGEKVTVTFGSATGETTADDNGKWSLQVDPPAAGGPYELTVAGKNNVKLTDVLVGEVWVASGQSNMEWSVRQSANPQEEATNANFPLIRMIKVPRNPAKDPQDDINSSDWKTCSPETVSEFSAVGYFFARKLHQDLNVPVGIINTSWGGTICEAWTSRPALEADPDYQEILNRAKEFRPNNPNQASVLYNGMIKPLIPFRIQGAIWYQGESNVSRAEQYAKLFPAMIADWRKNWNQGDFPFLYVQLAPFRYNGQDPRFCAELWEAQLKTLSVPNTGMAVTTDIGDIKDIHPKNKQEVGRRLALWALAKTYGKEQVYSGPLYDTAAVEGDKIRVKFKSIGGGLVAKEGQPLTHFEIAADDQKFVAAKATIDGDSVIVSSDAVPKPVAVRFAWTDTATPNLFNQEGLPASPFRTDSFPLGTAGRK